MDLPDKDTGCHRTGFEKKCRDLVVSGVCKRWITINGVNPNTGEPISGSKCVDDWGPFLQMEISQQARQAGASSDKVATEVAKFHANMEKANMDTMNVLVGAKTRSDRLESRSIENSSDNLKD